MTKKQMYQEPTALLENFSAEDIITLSNGEDEHNVQAINWVHDGSGML